MTHHELGGVVADLIRDDAVAPPEKPSARARLQARTSSPTPHPNSTSRSSRRSSGSGARTSSTTIPTRARSSSPTPCSGRPTARRVRFPSGYEAYAMCAIDALGIGADVWGSDRDRLARSTHRRGDPGRGRASDGRGNWQPPEEAVLLCGASGSGESCCSCCPVLNVLASTGNAERWLAARPEVDAARRDQGRRRRRSIGSATATCGSSHSRSCSWSRAPF